MKLAIVGSRSFNDYDLMSKTIESLVSINNIECIISGGASGADSLAETFAKLNGIELIVYQAEWDKYGKSAGMIRNADIVNASDGVIAFWDGFSKGTANSISKAEKTNKLIKIIRYENNNKKF